MLPSPTTVLRYELDAGNGQRVDDRVERVILASNARSANHLLRLAYERERLRMVLSASTRLMGVEVRAWVIASLVLANVAQAKDTTESFLCVADTSTGFKWNGSEWQDGRLHSDEKYTVARNGSKYVFTAVGDAHPEYECESTNPHVACENRSSRMVFNGETLRFAHYSTLGYTEGWDGDDLTPSVTLGRCTRL